MLKYLIFDLDETLYPRNAGLMQQIGVLINRYLIERLGCTEAQAAELRARYYCEYGTSLRGLMAERSDIDPEDYLRFVHDIRLQDYIGPNPELAEMLRTIPLTKVIFTNSTAEHAKKVVELLGVADQFSILVDVRAMDYRSKPDAGAYQRMLDMLQAKGSECILVEDSARNLRPAKALGVQTILVDSADCDEVDYCVRDILAVKEAVEKAIGRWGDSNTRQAIGDMQ